MKKAVYQKERSRTGMFRNKNINLTFQDVVAAGKYFVII